MASEEEFHEIPEGSQEDVAASQITGKSNSGGLAKATVRFTQIEVQGEIKFKCEACDKICDKEPGIKNHITRVHLTKKMQAEKREREKDDADENGVNKKTATQDVLNYVGTSASLTATLDDVLGYKKPEVNAEVVEVIEKMDLVNISMA